MNKLLHILIMLFLLVAFDKGFCNMDKYTDSSDITITSVLMGAMDADNAPSEFSIIINFTNHGKSIDKWQFGFYMPTPFGKLVSGSQNFNPRLKMQICDDNSKCSELNYHKAASIVEKDLSQGYTTILAPSTEFALLHGKGYTIKLLHNNQTGGRTVSYFPQNIFFVIRDQVYNVQTSNDTYKIVNYDKTNIDTAINEHKRTNWNNSIPYNSTPHAINIVPSPVTVQINAGQNYIIEKHIEIHNQLNSDNQIASMIGKALQVDIGVIVTSDNKADAVAGILIQRLSDATLIENNPEGYVLNVSPNNIVIQAINNAGVYYAFQTLRQLWNNGATIAPVTIIDYPRFKYRGILLDTVRHFFPINEIKSFIDLMAAHKLNTLHLHLADDEAFRVEIPPFPTLQSVASKRVLGLALGPAMFIQGNLFKTFDRDDFAHADTLYSGIYSTSDIASIIAYANAHQITVIPEIDLPAHARALIKALPAAFIDPNDKSQFISVQGYTDNVIPVCTYNTNISVGATFTKTINTIVNTVAHLFNGQKTVYAIDHEISIGGDEVSPNAWTNNSSCQGAWSGLSPMQRSHRFFQQMALTNPSIILSGWQQFVQTNDTALGDAIVPANRTGHVWVWNLSKAGTPQAINLANNGYPTVLVYADKTYFDLIYTPDINEPGLNWAGQYSDTQAALSSAVDALNTVNGTNSGAQGNVIGLEGALWSENLATYQQLIYMAVPKMAGLSEASWSPSLVTVKNMGVNWQSLAQRLGSGQSGFLAYLHKLYGVRYRGFPNGIKLEVPTGVCD